MQKPCFVLLPGAGMSDWLWSRMTPLLKFPFITVDRRLKYNTASNRMNLSLNDCVDYAMEKVTASGFGSFVIVGHSGSGLLAGLLASRLGDKACHTAYFAANIPAEGKTTLDSLPEPVRKANRDSVEKMVLANTIPYKLMEPLVRNFLCNDCDEGTIKFVLEQNFQPEPLCAVNEKMSWKNYPQVAQSYILAILDKTLSVDKQLEMAGNTGIKDVIRLEAGHMAMLSRPKETADILNSMAGRCAK